MVNVVIVPFHDYKKWNEEGFRTRDAHVCEHFSENSEIEKILVINRPTSLAEVLIKRKNWKTKGGEIEYCHHNAQLSKMKENENTQYIFLTKRPENINLKETPDNGWFGVTVTSSKEKTRIDYLRNNIKAKHYHITFEPMFDDVGKLDLNNISWIVIGTETGNRKGKISSKREWVFNIYNQAKEKNIPVFMKEDLLGILNEDEFVQEFPKEFGGIK